MNIKLKDSIYILEDTPNEYHVIFTSTRKVKQFQVDTLVQDIIHNLLKDNDFDSFVSSLSAKHRRKDILSCISSLEQHGIIHIYNQEDINPRYIKQVLFIDELTESWSETLSLQKRLEDSTVAVFGVGGIGC